MPLTQYSFIILNCLLLSAYFKNCSPEGKNKDRNLAFAAMFVFYQLLQMLHHLL